MLAGRPHDGLPGVDGLFFAVLAGHPATAPHDMEQLPQARRMAAEDASWAHLRNVHPELGAGSEPRRLSHVHGMTPVLRYLSGIQGDPFHAERLCALREGKRSAKWHPSLRLSVPLPKGHPVLLATLQKRTRL
jgi:hypothetical protein